MSETTLVERLHEAGQPRPSREGTELIWGRLQALCLEAELTLSEQATELLGSRRIIDELKERCAELENFLVEASGNIKGTELSCRIDAALKERS